jgi:hypothetical protein
LTFQDAQLRMLAYLRDRIHNGDLTERGFARMVGISQPHIHNVLNGVRNLSIDLSDSILKSFHMSILDLASLDELEAKLTPRKPPQRVSEVQFYEPILKDPVGPGSHWPDKIDAGQRFSIPLSIRATPSSLVLARLAQDPEMKHTLAGCDTVILDISERARAEPSPEGLYAVERNGEVLLRFMRPGSHGYYLVSDAARETPAEWDYLHVSRADAGGFIKARVLWLGREQDRHLPMHQRGRFL